MLNRPFRDKTISVKTPTVLFRIFVLITALGIALASGEIAVRIFFSHETDTGYLAAELRSRSIKVLTTPSRDPGLFYTLKPYLDIVAHGVRIRTNGEGFRIQSRRSEEKREGFRIAVLGDSTSFGWKVSYEESYPAIFAAMLEQHLSRPVILENYSVPGYNSRQEVHLFESRIMADPPDLIILHHDPNDADPAGDFQPPDYLHPEYGNNPLHSALFKFILRRCRISANERKREYDHSRHEHVNGHVVSGPLYERHLQALRRLKTLADARSVPIIAVLYSSEIQRDENFESGEHYTLLHRKIEEKLNPMGYHILDLFPLYQEEMSRRNWSDLAPWWISPEPPVDRHPNPAGHRFIAEQLYSRALSIPDVRRLFTD